MHLRTSMAGPKMFPTFFDIPTIRGGQMISQSLKGLIQITSVFKCQFGIHASRS